MCTNSSFSTLYPYFPFLSRLPVYSLPSIYPFASRTSFPLHLSSLHPYPLSCYNISPLLSFLVPSLKIYLSIMMIIFYPVLLLSIPFFALLLSCLTISLLSLPSPHSPNLYRSFSASASTFSTLLLFSFSLLTSRLTPPSLYQLPSFLHLVILPICSVPSLPISSTSCSFTIFSYPLALL